MPVVLLTLGRFPKGLDLARSFHAAGWRVIVVDPFSSHLMGVSRAVAKSYQSPAPADDPRGYIHCLMRIVSEEGIDLIVPVSEEVMYVAMLHEHLPAHVRLFTMPAALLHRVHDKFLFAQYAHGLGLSVPETHLASDPVASAVTDTREFVVKERHSCGGSGLSFHAAHEQFPRSEKHLVQARIRGVEHSSCTLAQAGEVRATAIYRGSVTSGTVAVGFKRVDHAAIEAWIARFVSATHWTGFISFDFIVDADGQPFAIECNPRVTSGIHFFETNDLAPAILDRSAPVRLRPQRELQQFWACLQEAVRELPNVAKYVARLRDIFRRRDVTWSLSDPWPLLTLPWTARELLLRASRQRLSLAVAATLDLAWTEKARIELGSVS